MLLGWKRAGTPKTFGVSTDGFLRRRRAVLAVCRAAIGGLLDYSTSPKRSACLLTLFVVFHARSHPDSPEAAVPRGRESWNDGISTSLVGQVLDKCSTSARQSLHVDSGICPSSHRPVPADQAAARQAERKKKTPGLPSSNVSSSPASRGHRELGTSLLPGIGNLASAGCDGFLLGMDDKGSECRPGSSLHFAFARAGRQAVSRPWSRGNRVWKAEMLNLETT